MGEESEPPAERPDDPSDGAGAMSLLRNLSQEKIVLLIAVLLFVSCSLFLGGFFTVGNLITIVRSVSVLGILAIGMGIVVIGRGIDLSMIAVMALSVAWFLELLNQSVPLLPALGMAVAAVVAVGLINGFLIAYAEVPAIFATLATGAFVFGFGRSQLISQDAVFIPPAQQGLSALGQLRIAGVPVEIFFFAAAAFAAFLVLRFTKYGRFIYYMGDNFAAARNTGMPVRPMIVAKYVVSALIAFFAGLITAGNLLSINTRVVNSTLLYDVILVVVIGGIGLSGGKGGIRNVIVGALLIGIMLNAMTIIDIPTIYQNLIKSTILLVAIMIDSVINPRDEQTAQQGDI
jgi:ribose transport system permease protein